MDLELDLFINQNLNWILDLNPFMNQNLKQVSNQVYELEGESNAHLHSYIKDSIPMK